MRWSNVNKVWIIRLTRIIRVPLLLPFLLVLSAVFVISDDLANGVVSGKYFRFYGSMGLISLVTLIGTLIGRRPFRFSAMDLLVLLFVAAVYLPAFLFNTATPNTTKLTLFTLLVVLYFSFRIIINTFGRKEIVQNSFCLFIILTGLVEVVWGMRQLYGFEHSQHNLFKLTGSFFNPGPYAGYLAMIFPMALHYWMHGTRYTVHEGKPDTEKSCAVHRAPFAFCFVSAITCIAILLVLPAAMSRASWLAVLVGSLVVIRFHYSGHIRRFYLRHKKQTWIAGGTIALFLFVATTGMYYLKKDSSDGRVLTWKISLQTVVKHPFGVGLGNFPGAYGEEQAAYFATGQATETEEFEGTEFYVSLVLKIKSMYA
jgi:hypothetical protein